MSALRVVENTPKQRQIFQEQIADALDALACTALAIATFKSGNQSPTTMQILDAIDLIADWTKAGVREGILQPVRNELATILQENFE